MGPFRTADTARIPYQDGRFRARDLKGEGFRVPGLGFRVDVLGLLLLLLLRRARLLQAGRR